MVPAKETLTGFWSASPAKANGEKFFLSMETALSSCLGSLTAAPMASEVPAGTVLPQEKTGPNDALTLLMLSGTGHQVPSKEGRVEALKMFLLNRMSLKPHLWHSTQNLDFIYMIEGRVERPLRESAVEFLITPPPLADETTQGITHILTT